MALITMYPGKVNSPELVLTSGIDAVATTIIVTGQINKLPAAPNIFVIGTGEDAETIFYPTDATGSNPYTFTGVTREFDLDAVSGDGAAKSWLAGEVVGRNFTQYDHAAFRANILTDDSPQASVMLMPGGAFVPTDNPADWQQGETTVNQRCHQYLEYSNTALCRGQWTIPLPAGWNGAYVSARFKWYSDSVLTGTVIWLLGALRQADGDDMDQALPNACSVTDTYQSTGKRHYTAWSTPFLITGTGEDIDFEVTRDYVTDTLGDIARLLSVEVKYVRAQNY